MADPEIVALRAKIASRPRSDDYHQRRRDMDARALQYGLPGDVSVEPVSANGVRAEWTATPGAAADAAILYLHGGGYVIGSLDSHRHMVAEAGRAANCRALALDYRLAPEHPFPAAIEDALSATAWVVAHAAELGLDPGRVGVCGDSAGATLAAVVSQSVTPRGRERLACQVLLCPIMDYAAESESRRSLGEGYLVDRATLEHDLRHYLPTGVDPADPRVSPLRAKQLHNLPPTCVHTAEYDPLRDEGAAYAEKLREVGVPNTYHCHPGMIHLFYGLGAVIPYSDTAFQLIGSDVRALLAR